LPPEQAEDHVLEGSVVHAEHDVAESVHDLSGERLEQLLGRGQPTEPSR
jgi:hypothetical protein